MLDRRWCECEWDDEGAGATGVNCCISTCVPGGKNMVDPNGIVTLAPNGKDITLPWLCWCWWLSIMGGVVILPGIIVVHWDTGVVVVSGVIVVDVVASGKRLSPTLISIDGEIMKTNWLKRFWIRNDMSVNIVWLSAASLIYNEKTKIHGLNFAHTKQVRDNQHVNNQSTQLVYLLLKKVKNDYTWFSAWLQRNFTARLSAVDN